MSEVKRYEVTEMGPTYHKRTEMLLSDDGCWVDYEDYAALKAERDALAAENAAMRDAIDCHRAGFSVCESCGEENGCHNDDVCRVLDEIEDTDAILNAVRVDSIENLADVLFESGAITIADAFTVIEHFAAQLRAGKDGE